MTHISRPSRLAAVLLAVAAVFGDAAKTLTASEWRQQSIYQVVTDRFARTDLSTTARCDTSEQVYCGGTWRGLMAKLDYIQDMGFTAVWISPVVKQVDGNTRDGSSYHGYWAQDIWSLNPVFGTAADLVALSAGLHARGMYLMVDVVTNHMAYIGCRSCVNYTSLSPFSSSSYFHSPCTVNYDSQASVEQCWQGSDTVSLPDLRTEDDGVRRIWNDWISSLVANYSVDGIRIDSAKHVEESFYTGFNSAAGVFTIGEVFHGDPVYLAPYQNHMDGVLDYASYYWITRAFQSPSGSISDLVAGLASLKSVALDLSLYGSFLENHDQARFPSLTRDMSLVKNAIAFTFLKDGIPILYQGQEQHHAGGDTPLNREALWLSGYSTASALYTWIAKLNQIRTRAISQDADSYLLNQAAVMYSDSRTVAVRKGKAGFQVVGLFTNAGSLSSSISVSLASSGTGFAANQALVDIVSCTAFTTDSVGDIVVTLNGGLPRIFYPLDRLSGSEICPPGDGIGTSTTPAASPTASPVCAYTSVAVTFNELVTTVFGDTVKIVGDTPSLGSWNSTKAVALDPSQYTTNSPRWFVTASLVPAAVIQYKFIKVSSSGAVTWEADPNRTYTVPCAASATVSSSWRG